MADSSIPVDLLNPGQVFACLGFMEAAEVLLGWTEGGFDWSDPGNVRFRLSAPGEEPPVDAVLAFLAKAKVVPLAPWGSRLSTEKWELKAERPLAGDPDAQVYPCAAPDAPATLVAALRGRHAGHDRSIVVDHWADGSGRDTVKFWAGSGGYPGAALLRDALDLVRAEIDGAAADPFNLSAPQSSSFRFDWRRDYIPLDAGFSPNRHGDIVMTGFPLVEILAAVGLTAARPKRLNKLSYMYAVLGLEQGVAGYPAALLRASLGDADLPMARRRFHMRLGWPGQENQARCITDVTEEPMP